MHGSGIADGMTVKSLSAACGFKDGNVKIPANKPGTHECLWMSVVWILYCAEHGKPTTKSGKPVAHAYDETAAKKYASKIAINLSHIKRDQPSNYDYAISVCHVLKIGVLSCFVTDKGQRACNDLSQTVLPVTGRVGNVMLVSVMN